MKKSDGSLFNISGLKMYLRKKKVSLTEEGLDELEKQTKCILDKAIERLMYNAPEDPEYLGRLKQRHF